MTMQDAQEGAAVYFDGTSSRKHQVTLRFGAAPLDAALEIVEDGAVVATWPFEAIRRADGSAVNRLRLSCTSAAPLARLEIEDEATIAAVTARSIALDVDRGGRSHVARIVFWSGAAVASILAMVVYGLPLIADRLTPLVPYSVEQRIGTAVDLQIRTLFGDKTCEAPAGKAAFRTMVEKLRVAGGIEHPLDANVLQHKVPNALALPGGRVYFFDSLLEKAESPDEVAGILAHELGHVHHRHVMRGIIHQGGTSYLAGLLLGDVMGGGAVILATRQLLQASHSRESEQEADDFATMVMRKLGRSPVPPTQLLFRITGEQGKKLGGFTILNSHPLTEDRLAAAKRNDVPSTGPKILSPDEWRALKAICKTS